MPRGRKSKTPQWAKEDSEKWILDELENWPDGLRLVDLTKALKGRVHKNTTISRLKELKKKGSVSLNLELRRYQIRDQGWDHVRRLEILDVIRKANTIRQATTIGAEKTGYLSTFIKYDDKTRPSRYPIGHKLLEKRALNFLDQWLRDLFLLAKDEGLISEDYFLQKKRFDEIPDETLKRVWSKLFPSPERLLIVEMIDTYELFNFLMTTWGKVKLNGVIAGDDAANDRYLATYTSSEQFLRSRSKR